MQIWSWYFLTQNPLVAFHDLWDEVQTPVCFPVSILAFRAHLCSCFLGVPSCQKCPEFTLFSVCKVFPIPNRLEKYLLIFFRFKLQFTEVCCNLFFFLLKLYFVISLNSTCIHMFQNSKDNCYPTFAFLHKWQEHYLCWPWTDCYLIREGQCRGRWFIVTKY